MGYESTIYIVEKTKVCDPDGKYYAIEIAKFDLGKILNISKFLINAKITDCYIYADDGNTRILEDRYGCPLTECTPDYLLDLLTREVDGGDKYRLYPLLIATLKTITQNPKYWKNVVCLHYGY